jgi:hypothetical protein
MFLNEGLDVKEVDEMIGNCLLELKELKIKLFAVWHYGSGEKNMAMYPPPVLTPQHHQGWS